MSVKDITFVWSLNYNNGRETCVWVKKKNPFRSSWILTKKGESEHGKFETDMISCVRIRLWHGLMALL